MQRRASHGKNDDDDDDDDTDVVVIVKVLIINATRHQKQRSHPGVGIVISHFYVQRCVVIQLLMNVL